jgi:hypothetical protein
MSKEGEGAVDGVQEYSEATRRVFEKTLTLVRTQLTETQVQALRDLLAKSQFHDPNELLKALRLEGTASAD